MQLPLKTLNRLRMGRDVAARVNTVPPGYAGWVYIYPIPSEHGVIDRRYGEARIVSKNGMPAIEMYLIRHLVADSETVQEIYAGQCELLGTPLVDDRYTVREDELAECVSQWLGADASFHIPTDVGYRFAGGPELLGPRGNLPI